MRGLTWRACVRDEDEDEDEDEDAHRHGVSRWSWREVRSRATLNMHTYGSVSSMDGRRCSNGSRSDKEVFSGLSRVLSSSRNTRQMELILSD